jgi:hypothetical protein
VRFADDGEANLPRYESGGKHRSQEYTISHGPVSIEPTNGQNALNNSVQVKETSSRRVGVDIENGQIVVFDETHPGKNIFHGHVRSWEELTQMQRNALIRANWVDRRGRIIIK